MSDGTRPKTTPEEVASQVEAIRAAAYDDDDEKAHCMEDDLHQDVLRAIALGECTDPATCARIALATVDIKFSRWHA